MVREKFKYLLLGQLFTAAVGAACVSVQCLNCSIIGETLPESCQPCHNTMCVSDTMYSNTSSSCKKDFHVSINSTGSDANEGDDIALTCVHNHPDMPLTYEWTQDNKTVQGKQNTSKLFLRKVLPSKQGLYVCYVSSACGTFHSQPHRVNVKSSIVVIVVVCGVAAMVLVLVVSVAMKIKLTRDNAKHRERMKQREQDGNRAGP